MRTALAAAAAFGLMAFANTPSGNPSLDTSAKITHPDWARRPSGEDIAQYYPEKAQRLELEGRATVLCKVGVDGRLRDCEVVEESPPDAGFGEATKRLAEETFRMTPMTRDGVPVDGASVRIPLVYKLPPPGAVVIRKSGPGQPLELPKVSPLQLALFAGGLIGGGLLLIGAILMWDLRRRKTDL